MQRTDDENKREIAFKSTERYVYFWSEGMERKYSIIGMYKYINESVCVDYDGFVMLKGDTFYAISSFLLTSSSVFRLIFPSVSHNTLSIWTHISYLCVRRLYHEGGRGGGTRWLRRRRSRGVEIYCSKVIIIVIIIQVKMRREWIFHVITTYLLTFGKYDLIIQINT